MVQCVCATKRVTAKCIHVSVLQRVAVSVVLRHVAVCMCDKVRDSKMYSCVCVAACCSECGVAACCCTLQRHEMYDKVRDSKMHSGACCSVLQ